MSVDADTLHRIWAERWMVYERRHIDKLREDGSFGLGDGRTTGYGIRVGNLYAQTPEDYEVQFGPEQGEEAQTLAAEFNRYEWQGPLDPEFADRRDRLKRLAPDFGSFYYEGPPEARWPVRPGKYLVRDGGVGWHAEATDSLADDLEGVREAIAGDESNVYSVIDLDTGEEVPFEREVSVVFGGG